MSRSSIYAAIANGTFPKQVRLGPRAVGWLEGDVSAWINQRQYVGGEEQIKLSKLDKRSKGETIHD